MSEWLTGPPALWLLLALGLALQRSWLARHLGEQLQRSRARERTLLEQAPFAVLVLDLDAWEVVDANERAGLLFGLNRRELVAQPFKDWLPGVLPPDGVPAPLYQQISRAMAVGSATLEQTFRSRQGRDMVCEVWLSRLPSQGPQLLRLSCVDVTERKRTEAELRARNEQWRALLDAALEVAIIATDAEGRVTLFSSCAQLLLGYGPVDLLGQPLDPLFSPQELAVCAHELGLPAGRPVPAVQVLAELVRDAVPDARNWTLAGKHGREVHVSMTWSKLRDARGRAVGYMAMARDITGERAAQFHVMNLGLRLASREQELAHGRGALPGASGAAIPQPGTDQRRTFNLKPLVEDAALRLLPALRGNAFTLDLAIPEAVTMHSYPQGLEQLVASLMAQAQARGMAAAARGDMHLRVEAGHGAVRLIYTHNGQGAAMADCQRLVTGLLGGRLEATDAREPDRRGFVATLPLVAPVAASGATQVVTLGNKQNRKELVETA